MASRLTGQSIDRFEDPRLLRGEGRFFANLALPGARHVAFVRSTVAHANVHGIDISAARAAPGVEAVLTAQDLAAVCSPLQMVGPPELAVAPWTALASDKVRHVGDPVAMVVAATPAAAVDAATLVEVDYEPLPAVVDQATATAAGAPPLFDELGTNVVYRASRSWGPVDEVFDRAQHVVRRTFVQGRASHAPIEGRGIAATWEPADRTLTLEIANKRPHSLKLTLSNVLGLPFGSIRARCRDIGGAFGSKGQVSREDVAVAAAAVLVGGTLRWVEDRTENLLTAGHAREETIGIEGAFDADGRLRGLRATMALDQGAYPMLPFPASMFTTLVMMLMPNAYRLDAYGFDATVYATNKASYIAYRGPWAAETWVRERLLDEAAAELGLGRDEIRLLNLVGPEHQPTALITGPSMVNAHPCETLERALELIDLEAFGAEQEAARAQGRHLGLGIATFVENAPGPPDFAPTVGFDLPSETAWARLEPSGDLTISTWQVPHGQGHETTIVQCVADETGLPPNRIRLQWGDSESTPFNTISTGGSRSATMGRGAALGAAREVTERIVAIAAHLLEANEADLEIADGVVSVRGTPARSMAVDEIARVAWFAPSSLPPGSPQGITVTHDYRVPEGGWAAATHCCWVEVDIETGAVTIPRYLVVEDCGTPINPAVVDGQVTGAVAQGLAAVLYERHDFDDDGQPLTATLATYLVPSAAELPPIEIEHLHLAGPDGADPVPLGVGEGGTIAAPAALTNAIADALAPFGCQVTESHLPPQRIVELAGGLTPTRPTPA